MSLWILGLVRAGQGEADSEGEQGGESESGTSEIKKLVLIHAERVS